MIHVVRWFFIAVVTFIITIFVVDFQAVVDAFSSLVDTVSDVLSPLKVLIK